MKHLAALTITMTLLLFLATPLVSAEVTSLEPPVIRYNDGAYEKFDLSSPILLENEFITSESTYVYFKLLADEENRAHNDPDWVVRMVLWKSDWEYTDFATVTPGSVTPNLLIYPNETYTLQTWVQFPLSDISLGEVYEVSVVLAEDLGGMYHPSQSFIHQIAFSEELTVLPTDYMIHYIGISLVVAFIIVLGYVWKKESLHEKDKKE